LPPHSIPSPLPAPTAHLSPLPLHDALPIYPADRAPGRPGTGSTGHRVDRAPGLRIRLGSGLELVAEPAHRGEQPRLRGIDLDLRPQTFDMDVAGLRIADIVLTPDAVDELSAGHHSPGGGHEELEQPELLERHGQLLTSDGRA